MKKGRLQAKDIDDRAVLAAVRELAVDGPYGPQWVMVWDLEEKLGIESRKLMLAKCAALINRGLLDGCPCGCRGDFKMTAAGDAFLDGAS